MSRVRGRGRVFKIKTAAAQKGAAVAQSPPPPASAVERADVRPAGEQLPAVASSSQKGLPSSDARSELNIATLLPEARSLARRWLTLCRDQGLPVVVIVGTRTFEEQARLYAQGRTAPGVRVTNARPGSSKHNYGAAWDYVVFESVNERGGVGQPLWSSPAMDRAGELAESLGLVWGGRFKNLADKPHVELAVPLQDLRRRYPHGYVP